MSLRKRPLRHGTTQTVVLHSLPNLEFLISDQTQPNGDQLYSNPQRQRAGRKGALSSAPCVHSQVSLEKATILSHKIGRRLTDRFLNQQLTHGKKNKKRDAEMVTRAHRSSL